MPHVRLCGGFTARAVVRCGITDFSYLLFLHTHREASALVNELPEESDQFRFLRAACLANIKGFVGLIFSEAFDHVDFYTV